MPDEYFKQSDEKHVSTEVYMLVWAPKMDLIALANAHGEVVLHRLSWQKVWTLAAPSEGDMVGGLAWRPDSKVLAIGYQSGKIRLVDIEKGEILHATEVEGEVTSMSWTEHKYTADSPFTSEPYGEDTSSDYLPRLQPLNKNYRDSSSVSKDNLDEVVEDSKKLKDQKELNFLIVGTNKDSVHVIVYGVFPFAQAAFMIQDGSQERRVCSAILTDDLHSLSVVVESTSDESDEIDYYILTFDTTLIMSRHKEVRMLALKYGLICCLVEHLQTTIQQMSEAWEDILTEMDSKLLKFAEEKKKSGHGTVSNDFLELLLFGLPSTELQNFLLHELTDKGLKKLGFSIETSYSNIQKLVVKHLQAVSQAIMYHLSELRGMAQWFDKFGVLGLDPAAIQEAINAAGTFVLCASDLQQVIDGSIKNFKAFFRWLYVVILRLSKEEIPAELGKINQHQLDFVAEFLRDNFSHFIPEEHKLFSEDEQGGREAKSVGTSVAGSSSSQKKPRFKMEKVGQYLKREDLAHPSNLGRNPWVQFVGSSAVLKESKVLYPIEGTKSLLQLQDTLESALRAALGGSMETVSQSLQYSAIYHLFTLTDTVRSSGELQLPPKVCQFTDNTLHHTVTLFTNNYLPHQVFYVLRQPTDVSKVEEEDMIVAIRCSSNVASASRSLLNTSGQVQGKEEGEEEFSLLDLGRYDPSTLTMLLTSQSPHGRPALVQFSLPSIPSHAYCSVNTTENIVGVSGLQTVELGHLLTPGSLQHLDNIHAHSLAVSLRKTAAVLFHSRRRVRILMMEEDDDEDEDEMEETGVGEENSLMQKSDVGDTSMADVEDENKENTTGASSGGPDADDSAV
ncbi:anaphase-promoting complex subunit 4-like [Babylonia areolata]|uniref:anaphase-promoting complex subunit 4-like n=1 Tax=Babylonia areolata TaxID=304850 RepID=UPI003FCF5374